MIPTPTAQDRSYVEWKTLLLEKELWLLVLAGILCFYQPLFTKQTFFFRDLFIHFLPQRRLFVQLLHQGELPLWDPYLSGGQPFLGDVQNLALYPTGVLYLFLPLLTAFNIELVLHVVFSSVAMYLLARSMRLSPIPACVAALVYGYCGYTVSLANVMNRLLAMPYLPLTLLFWRQFLSRRRWGWFALTALAGAVQILAGAPEMTLITYGFLLLWSLFQEETEFSLLRRIALWCLLLVFIAGVAGVQILPSLEMTQQSSRSEPGTYKIFAAWSINPKRLPELFVSNFLGYTSGLTKSDYWGSTMEDRMFPYILSIYFGAVTLLLAAIAPFLRGTSSLSARFRAVLLSILVVATLFSCGRYVPFFDYFYKAAFLINRFRYPIKFLVGAVLPAALLAGVSVEMLFEKDRPLRIPIAILWTFSGGLILICAVFLFWPAAYMSFLHSYFGTSAALAEKGVLDALFHTAAIALAATLIVHVQSLRPGRWQQTAVTLLLAVDLFYAGYFVNWYAPSEFFTDKPSLTYIVGDNLEGGRFFRDQDPKDIVLKMPANDIIYAYRWSQETLYDYVGAYYKIPLIYHKDFDGLGKMEIQRLARYLYSTSWDRRGAILTASGVTLIFAPTEVDLPGVTLMARIHTTSNKAFYLFKNTNAANARFISRTKRARDSETAFKLVTDAGFDPTSEVILEEDSLQDAGAGPCDPAAVQSTILKSGSASYKVEAPCNGFVVFSEPYYPGWEITIDHKPARLLKANFAFSAVQVPAGSHSIERVYRPASARNGLLLSLLFTTVLVALSLAGPRLGQTNQK